MHEQISLLKNVKRGIPMMPESYKAKVTRKNNRDRRKWTPEELDWVRRLDEDKYTRPEIAKSIGRSLDNANYGINKIRKQDNTYNEKHVELKYNLNIKFIEMIKPKSVLDLFCGDANFYKGKVEEVVSNDNKHFEGNPDYREDALDLLCTLYPQKKKYDLIDLDPYGSAYDCFDLAIKMAQKGLIITLGDIRCKRWKNKKFIENYYHMNVDEFNENSIIEHIQRIGYRNKKYLIPVLELNNSNIYRVYFIVENFK